MKNSELSFFYFIYMVFNFFFTRVFFRKHKIVRLPIFIRGGKRIFWGDGISLGRSCRIETFGSGEIHVSDGVQLNDHVHIAAYSSIFIEKNVLIASKVFISDLNHGCYDGSDCASSPEIPPAERKLFSRNVTICENVWIGEGAAILAGVTIGKGSIIGTNAVVTKDIPSNSIAVGIPAKVIKRFDSESNKWISI